jgi:hypothetical protein
LLLFLFHIKVFKNSISFSFDIPFFLKPSCFTIYMKIDSSVKEKKNRSQFPNSLCWVFKPLILHSSNQRRTFDLVKFGLVIWQDKLNTSKTSFKRLWKQDDCIIFISQNWFPSQILIASVQDALFTISKKYFIYET